ncbi:MAG: DUF1415 domain-containing protein [Cocleimonas sp.]
MSKNSSDIIDHTKKWLSTFVIAHNICPFAKKPYIDNSIQYHVFESSSLEKQLESLIHCCEELDTNPEVETSLVIYPSGLDDFDDYLDFLALANSLLSKQGYEGIYQLASFHPNYCFAELSSKDASHYTNRSPYPVLHLIREENLALVLSKYPNPEKIPQRNIEYTRELGVETLKKILTLSET